MPTEQEREAMKAPERSEPISAEVLERLHKATSRLEIAEALKGVSREELAKCGIV